MTPQQYRTHPNAALRKAFLSGELVGLADALHVSNPYRVNGRIRSPRRGSWSESYARAWALGKDEGSRALAEIRRAHGRQPDAAHDGSETE